MALLINFRSYDEENKIFKKIPTFFSILIGGILGFFSGVVGIGGGIFLSPILFLLKVAKQKQIVTAASLFILINSVSGIIGHLTKATVLNEIQSYWFLLLTVLIGFGLFLIFNPITAFSICSSFLIIGIFLFIYD